MTTLPVIALTAGDVSGVGPEIVLKSLCSDAVRSVCQPLVICDPDALNRARVLCGHSEVPLVVSVAKPLASRQQLNELLADAALNGSVLCVNPAGHIVEDFPKGQMHAASGEAASISDNGR